MSAPRCPALFTTSPFSSILAMALLPLLCLAGCRHPQPAPPPPAATTAPPITPSSITVITPLPSVPPKRNPDVTQQAQTENPPAAPPPAAEKPKRRAKHKAPATTAPDAAAPAVATHPATPATGATGTSAPAPDTTAAPTQPAPAEAANTLGQLSAGNTITTRDRSRILVEIQEQDARFAKVPAPSSSEARAVQIQVRSFLAKARQALTENDLDGAETLTTKARVLLNELLSE
ncbi:hypothetical protein [Acidipila sp. EB88]|uniref:hypothetical protein n=1 Tax=Acidipila sp. EB88 TaxID=2305226 RepID=UPI000F5E8CE4|nr:hypothetical protein [Acidipila sp. EB88]RRA47217.1 hypothetical protein D1Y84_01840 [Acidipila sp. EB88]